ncbi:MAG: Holliday junction branch migration protein RuvA [Clostridiales bacterium]|nr:Holliday junction branch migration protein RuvA [Eubacterium sp.]MDD7349940.1 Holliday junction branch migration protein RuvA [Clostridiales bacterium]
MIHFIKGQLDTVSEQKIVVENQGMGYEILVPASVLSKLPAIGMDVKIYIYMHVREDALQLYGFATKEEKEMFQLLITVNGIGPKGALGILSIMDVDALRFAILSEDAKSISKAPGIGGKTASKLILELKDKVDFEEAVDTMLTKGENAVAGVSAPAEDVGYRANDAIQALVALGYSSTEAVKAVKKVDLIQDMTTEEILKSSLKYL